MSYVVIRPVEQRDDLFLFRLIVDSLREYGLSGAGTVEDDPEIQSISKSFNKPDSGYWVVEDKETGRVLGGGGLARLKGTTEKDSICEFQKMYLVPEARGIGIGSQMLAYRIERAKEIGYRFGYMETIPTMHSVKLFEKFGFQHLQSALGNTGHSKLQVFMLREL
jgi:putative acetyltransferase